MSSLGNAGSCYSHPWVAIVVAIGIAALAIVTVFRSRHVARFVVENLLGPWRANPARQVEWRDSIEAWISTVRILLLFFASGAVVVALLAAARSVSCA